MKLFCVANKKDKSCEDFNIIANTPDFQEYRDFLEILWEGYSKICGDPKKHFLNKVVTSFNQAIWELLLFGKLKESKKIIIENAMGKGPDFKFSINGVTVWIEAVCVNYGTGSYQDDPLPRNRAFVLNPSPYRLRLAQGIADKLKKINEYLESGHIGKNQPIFIALNAGGLEKSRLLWKDINNILYDKSNVIKKGKSNIETGYFHKKEYSCISGIIFSHVSPKDFSMELKQFQLLNNPNAKIKSPKEMNIFNIK